MGTRHWPEDADDEVERLEGVIKHFRAEVARLKEELAAIRQQQSEPVAWCVGYDDWRLTEKRIHSNPTMCREEADALCAQSAGALKLVPLYSAPPAQSEPFPNAQEDCAALGIDPAQSESERDALPPIDYDAEMDRYYIPVHQDWEVQTKGKGSSFRIANIKTEQRLLVLDQGLHEMLEQMARDIHAAMQEGKK